MKRLTLTSVQSTLAEYGISLTGKSGKYTVVVQSGYSATHSTLAEVMEHCESHMFRYGSEEVVELDDATKEEVALAADLANELNIQTEPTVSEVFCTQSTRVNQLFSYAHNCGVDLDWLRYDTSMEEDEEEIAAQLVREADERRAHKQAIENNQQHYFDMMVNHSSAQMIQLDGSEEYIDYLFTPIKENISNLVICRGFSTNTRRVSKQLQRRANKFHNMLETA